MSVLQTTQLNVADGMIDFGVGQPSLVSLPLDELRTAAAHRLGQGSRELLAYGADQGDGHFRKALAQFLSARYTVPVNADQLMVTASASQALDLICTRFTKPGDTIFVEAPTYFLALLIFRDHGLNVVGIPIDENGLRMSALEDALTRHKPVLLYTIPAFQNPSAVTMPAERRRKLVELSEQHDFLVVADEVYHLLDFGNKPPLPLATYGESGRVLSLGSFSKISAPGLRLGWVQASQSRLHTLIVSGLLESGGGLNPFTSGVMQSMIELGLLDSVLDEFRRVYSARCAALSGALREYLPAAKFVEPEGGFFIWMELPGGRPMPGLITRARKNGVGFQPGERFGANDVLAHYVRLSFAHYEEAELVEGVRRLAGVIGAG